MDTTTSVVSDPIPIPVNGNDDKISNEWSEKDESRRKSEVSKLPLSSSLDKNKYSCILLHEPSTSIASRRHSRSESGNTILERYSMPYSTPPTNSPYLHHVSPSRQPNNPVTKASALKNEDREFLVENIDQKDEGELDQSKGWHLPPSTTEETNVTQYQSLLSASLSSGLVDTSYRDTSFLSQSYGNTSSVSTFSDSLLPSSSLSPPHLNLRHRSTSYDASTTNSQYEGLLDKTINPNSIPNIISDPKKKKQLVSEVSERLREQQAEKERLQILQNLYHNYYLKKEQKQREFYENYQKVYKEKTKCLYDKHSHSKYASVSSKNETLALVPYGYCDIDNNMNIESDYDENSLALTLYNPSVAAPSEVKSRALVLHRKGFIQGKAKSYQTYNKKTIYDIPDENIDLIIDLLDAPSLCALSQVDRYFQKATNNDRYWYSLCLHEYGVDSKNLDPPPDPIKDLYRVHYLNFLSLKKSLLMNGVHINGPNISSTGINIRLNSQYAGLVG